MYQFSSIDPADRVAQLRQFQRDKDFSGFKALGKQPA